MESRLPFKVKLKALELKLRSSGEGILPQDCNMEILSEFPSCQPALQISDVPSPTPPADT